MNGKDLIRGFRAASWTSQETVRQFIDQAGARPSDEIERLLDTLLEHKGSPREAIHQNRLYVFAAIAEASLERSLFVPFVRALRRGDPQLVAILADFLPKVNNIEGHALLCAAVGDERQNVREAAARTLAQVAGPQALEALVELVKHAEYKGRVEACEALVAKAQHRALPLLVSVLNHGSPMERARVLKWLGDGELMGREREGAADAITRALDDPHERVAAQAVSAFAGIASEEHFFTRAGHLAESPRPYVAQAFINALKNFPSLRGINALTRIYRTAAPQLRIAVVDTLGAIGSDAVLPVLVEAIADDQLPVRNRVMEVMVKCAKAGQIELGRTIIWLLRSRNVDVRRLAVELAREVGDPSGELMPKLLRFLRDEDWWVRERVMDALVEMSGQRLTEHIVGYLKDDSDVVRRYAVGALRRLKDPRSLGALVRVAMGDEDWWVREEAVAAIGELGDMRAVPYLLKLVEDDSGNALSVILALDALQAKESCNDVAHYLSIPDENVRIAGLRFLERHGGPQYAHVLEELEADASLALREAIARARSEWQLQAQAARIDRERLSALDRLLIGLEQASADDLILTAGRPAYMKAMGQLVEASEKPLSASDLEVMLYLILNNEQRERLDQGAEIDVSHEVKSHGLRFRVNVFKQLTGIGAVFRVVKNQIPNIDDLGLPEVVKRFGDLKNGLVLVGGPTGSGKSTTLAALIDYINRSSNRHIVTIEDPIEVIHQCKESLLNQRENGTHTLNFERALRSTLRQDPDVILVGEMRDLETISFAVNAAETGHLVFGTVHTVSADASIDRILNTFPPGKRQQVRSMLSETLRAVVCQHLLPRHDQEGGRVLAVEVMVNNDAISNLIRKDKCYQIPTVVATHTAEGMQSMDAALAELVRSGFVEESQGYMRALDKKMFEALVAGKDGAATAAQAPQVSTPGDA